MYKDVNLADTSNSPAAAQIGANTPPARKNALYKQIKNINVFPIFFKLLFCFFQICIHILSQIIKLFCLVLPCSSKIGIMSVWMKIFAQRFKIPSQRL